MALPIVIGIVGFIIGSICIAIGETADAISMNTVNSGYTSDAYNNLDIQLETSGVTNGISINSLDTTLETEAALVESTVYEVVDLTKMLEEHKENPFRAETLYLNKYVEITGCIVEFQKYRIDSPYDHVCLYDGISDKFRYIYGLATDNIKNELVNYSKGDFVTMRGKVVRVETVGYQILIDSLEKCE